MYSENYFKLKETRSTLPAYKARQEIIDTVKKYQTVVLQGDTGSGKTTQVPQFLLECGEILEAGKMIACTQPRRVAAMSVAKRVSEEMDVELSATVGYTIRFEDRSSPETRLKY
jgi:HrpA-like RNA helicase